MLSSILRSKKQRLYQLNHAKYEKHWQTSLTDSWFCLLAVSHEIWEAVTIADRTIKAKYGGWKRLEIG